MSLLPTVLIFTLSEHGQANVNLATSYELALAGVNVYIASFLPLKNRVAQLQELIDRHASHSTNPRGSVAFREIKGIASYKEAVEKHGFNSANCLHPHGVSGALESYARLDIPLFPWSQGEYLTAIAILKEIIVTVKPNAVGVDPLFSIAQDACKLADQKFVIISPVSIKEAAANVQPYLALFWKYPVLVATSRLILSLLIFFLQFVVGIPVPSRVVANPAQHLSLHSTHHPNVDCGEIQTNPNLA